MNDKKDPMHENEADKRAREIERAVSDVLKGEKLKEVIEAAERCFRRCRLVFEKNN